jgi:putative phosphoesterase
MTRIGLLSDSHGRHLITRQAVEVLRAEGIHVLIHLGDIGSAGVLEELVGAEAGGEIPEVHMVFGNVDLDREVLARAAEELGIHVHEPMGILHLEGKSIAFHHGDEEALTRKALAEEVDYLCHGHTHRPRDEHMGHTRVVNPGALFRARRLTVGLLDVEADDFRILEVVTRF